MSRTLDRFHHPQGSSRLAGAVRVSLDRPGRQIVEMACSLLLDYPEEDMTEEVAQVRAELGSLPRAVAASIEEFCAAAESMGVRASQEHYVRTFDHQRRCALYLSYFVEGDTRGRGQAILAFREIMQRAGFEQVGNELPDYVPVCLEFAALDDSGTGEELVASHREGLEVVRSALTDSGSHYARLLDALLMILPSPSRDTVATVRRLISQGPPTELVGLGMPGGGAPVPDPLNVQPVPVGFKER